ncbi:MAG TPA: hypothetical protein VH969_15035 [Actinophytocola sp.]|jgi:hypothetical protein|uniref:hypothetical protein n=1 Tax=Actinophytocola sp. TaxID=1872138 RepID=UPI002F92A8F8
MITDSKGDWTSTARATWLWIVAVLVGFPVGGGVADLLVDGVDSVGAALAAGLVAGAIIGAAEWFALRRWVSWAWIVATGVGMPLGLAAGAALVDYGTDRGDVVVIGAATGVGVGALQAIVLMRHRVPGAFWWAVANPVAWALGWFVTSYVITTNVEERFPNFGASGALVFGLLTWLLLAVLCRTAAPEVRAARASRSTVR